MMLRKLTLAVVLTAAMTGVGFPSGVAAAAPGTAADELYYTVAPSYQGAPENLWQIADRFLGDAGRAGEILELNSGRVQPDGGRLADPSRLAAGWQLVLPWDAVGAGLQRGPLPAKAGGSSRCGWDASAPAAALWGQTLLTPNRAWSTTDGSGVKVAVIGSGVDGAADALTGRVTAGVDIAAGSGGGDTGCEGTGTSLAGIVAGDDGENGARFGVAPGARIVPIRAGAARLSAALAATGIEVAADTGAQVVLVGIGVDAADPVLRAAISDAIARDVVVVLPASAAAEAADGLLRVGAVTADRQPADDHPVEAVDLRAPGVAVASIGRPGTGAEYAAAFVAGTVALVRSAHPELGAADVTRQVLATTVEGMVSPVAAVTTSLPAGTGVDTDPQAPEGGLATLSRVLFWIAVVLGVLTLLTLLLQRPARLLGEMITRRRAHRQALAARARISDDNDDPFWKPPNSGGPSGRGEVAELRGPVR